MIGFRVARLFAFWTSTLCFGKDILHTHAQIAPINAANGRFWFRTARENTVDFQPAKTLVLNFYDALDNASPTQAAAVMERFLSPDILFRAFHPFGELQGDPAQVAETVWVPLKTSLSRMQRRMDIFFAGQNSLTDDDDGSVWVASMGHLMGLFDAPLLGIRPTGKIGMLRYAEFLRVQDGRITEVAFYFDLPHLMAQAGQNPFPPQTGAQLIQPGPLTHDGLLFADAERGEGVATLAAINAMISDLGQWNNPLPLEEELALTWQDDMLWWGPTGIGATYTIERYAKQHSGPFRAAFANRSGTGHVCRMAEGAYGGFFGWPNFRAVHTGGFMGLPGREEAVEFRVIDLYRRGTDKLAENWIFIDMLHFMQQQGVDVLLRNQTTSL